MIRVNNVSHYYGLKRVLEDISVEVRRGELLAVMGQNGAGKSTLLNLMAGLMLPCQGEVTIDGVPRRASEEQELELRRKVVYLPASPWLAGGTAVGDWLYRVGRLYGRQGPQLLGHCDRLLDLFNLTDHVYSPIKSCSTGQQKKVAVCAALVTKAPVMILDEPFAGGLDPSAIYALEQVLRRLADDVDTTVVIASQIPELVEVVASRVLVVHDNKAVALGTVDELRAKHGGESLGETFERITQPDTMHALDRYFGEEPGGRI